MTSIERRIRKLTELKLDEPAVVAKIKLDRGEADRLDELGLHVGSAVRVLAGTLGYEAVNALLRGMSGVMVGQVNGRTAFTPFEEACSRHNEINRKQYEIAHILSL